MKTTIDIPDAAFAELARRTNAPTKRAAILTAVEDYNRRHRVAAAVGRFGHFKSVMTNDEIEAAERRERHG